MTPLLGDYKETKASNVTRCTLKNNNNPLLVIDDRLKRRELNSPDAGNDQSKIPFWTRYNEGDEISR